MNIGCSVTEPMGAKSRGSSNAVFAAFPGAGRNTDKRRHIKRIAVGRGLGRGAGGYDTTAAGLIDRHDLLAPDLAQPIGDHAQRDVDRTARRRIGDDLDRAGRIVLGLRGAARLAESASNQSDNDLSRGGCMSCSPSARRG